MWLLLLVVVGMVCCIETTKTPQKTSWLVVVGMVCLSFVFVCCVIFFFPCGLCSGMFSLLLGVMPCSFFCVLCCLCCGVCFVCVVVVRMVVVVGCRWSGLFYRNNENTKKNMFLLLI